MKLTKGHFIILSVIDEKLIKNIINKLKSI